MSALDRLYQTMAVVSAGLRPLNPRPDIRSAWTNDHAPQLDCERF